MLGFLVNDRVLQAKLVRLKQSKADMAALVYSKQLAKVEREVTNVTAQMEALAAKAQCLGLEVPTVDKPPQRKQTETRTVTLNLNLDDN